MFRNAFLPLQQTTSTIVTEASNSPVFTDITTGALLGFAATMIAAFGVWYLNKRNRRNSIRKAIVAELEKQEEELDRIIESLGMDGPIDADDGADSYEIDSSDLPPSGSIPTTVYHSNAANLGELPGGEVEEIVDYYSNLNKQIAIIEAVRKDEDVLPADKRSLHTEMPKVGTDRTDLVSKLNAWSICGFVLKRNSR